MAGDATADPAIRRLFEVSIHTRHEWRVMLLGAILGLILGRFNPHPP